MPYTQPMVRNQALAPAAEAKSGASALCGQEAVLGRVDSPLSF